MPLLGGQTDGNITGYATSKHSGVRDILKDVRTNKGQ